MFSVQRAILSAEYSNQSTVFLVSKIHTQLEQNNKTKFMVSKEHLANGQK